MTNWQARYVCPCGQFSILDDGFSSPFFKPQPCPKCGEPRQNFRLKIVRWVRHGWFKGGHYEERSA